MATQQERRELTRANLIATARSLLIHEGVKGTTTREILDTAQVSRGAMYHHFKSHEDLIAEVFSEESKGAIDRALQKRKSNQSPIDELAETCLAWLDEIVDAEVARIIVIEGPKAIGWARCRKIEEQHSLKQLGLWLQAACDNGEIDIPSVTLTANMINALLTEAALAIVVSEQPLKMRDQAIVLIMKFIQSLNTN